ncbi:MAG: type II secretion system protein N [Pseudomonadales bacterium]|nr:type II secretion system protein N [Pseudomonadales bacterium]
MERIVDRLLLPLKVLLVLGIAWTAADGVLFFLGGAETDLAAPAREAPRAGGAQARQTVPAAEIAAAELFGRPTAGGPAAEQAVDAPETRLQLELHGVFLAEENAASSAIVAERNRDGKLYVVGDRMPGSAELVSVLDDRIVLRRAGALETLRFPKEGAGRGFSVVSSGGQDGAVDVLGADDGDFSTLPDGRSLADLEGDEGGSFEETDGGGALDAEEGGAAAGNRSGGGRGGIGQALDALQRQLDEDPAGTLASYGVEPVEAGGGSGYRIGSNVPAAALARVGLKEGDVVLSVNGRPVGDIQQDRAQLQEIADQGSARLEIQRGDRRFFVTTRIR